MQYYLKTVEETLSEVKATTEGLSSQEAAARLQSDGQEQTERASKRFSFQEAHDAVCRSYDYHPDRSSGDFWRNIVLCKRKLCRCNSSSMAVVIINAILGVYQESKPKKPSKPAGNGRGATSKVYRDGKLTTVKSEDLVKGDIVVLEAGDAVPADGRIIQCASMKIEEAALTGESVPVDKTEEVLSLDGEKEVPLGDRKNMVYMGSTVVYGRGMIVVCDTGMDTEMGKIADALAQAKDGKTPLQIKLAQLSKILTVLVLVICVIIFAVSLLRAGAIDGEVVLDTFMVAVSLAVAAIPEGLAAGRYYRTFDRRYQHE